VETKCNVTEEIRGKGGKISSKEGRKRILAVQSEFGKVGRMFKGEVEFSRKGSRRQCLRRQVGYGTKKTNGKKGNRMTNIRGDS